MIDNINNKNASFIDILTKSSEDTIKKTIKNNNIITRQINNSLMNFDFNFYNITQINKNEIKQDKEISISKLREKFWLIYKKDLIYEISKNEDLKSLTITSILNLFKKEKDGIFIKIFKNNIINIENTDFIEELNQFIEHEIKIYLKKVIYLFDNEQILVTFICNENIVKCKLIRDKLNEYIDNIGNIITNINFDDVNLNNKIITKILYGIRIPFIQTQIENDIFNYIKTDITKLYIKNEDILLKKIEDDKKDAEKKRYLDNSNTLSNRFKNELINYQLISKILESNEEKLIKDLFSDCFHIFLKKNVFFIKNYDSLIKLLEIIIQLRFMPRLNNDIDFGYFVYDIKLSSSFLNIFKVDKNNDINEIIDENEKNISYTQIFADVLIFIESFSKEIYSILKLFEYLNDLTGKDNIEEIKKIICEKKFQRKKQKINTICFYFVIESILLQIIKYLVTKDFFEIITNFKKLNSQIMKLFEIDKTLSLFSNELFTFELLINIFEYYTKQSQEKEKEKKDEINKGEYEIVIKKIMESDELFLQKKDDEFNKNLNEINEHLKKIFDEYSNEYAEFMIVFALNRYQLTGINKIKENMLNLLIPDDEKLANKNILEKLYPLISLILDKSEPEINLDERKNKIFKIIKLTLKNF